MSTSLDDLPILDDGGDDGGDIGRDIGGDVVDRDPRTRYSDDRNDRKDRKDRKDPPSNYGADSGLVDVLIDKLKEPALVTVIMLVLTNPIFIKMLLQLPYLEVYSNSQSINVGISILAGCVFFIIKEFIFAKKDSSDSSSHSN